MRRRERSATGEIETRCVGGSATSVRILRMVDSSPLSVFLAHAKEDGELVREIFYLLRLDGFAPWIDKENLIPGQDWEYEIRQAVRVSDVVVAFISSSGVNRDGFLHKEIRLAIDAAEQKPEGTIFIVPVRLDDCKIPERLARYQWATPFGVKVSRVFLPSEGEDEIVTEREIAPCTGRDVSDVYVSFQEALITRAFQLKKITKEQYETRPSPPYQQKGFYVNRIWLIPGRYLVRGQNPDGPKYYGTAQISLSKYQYKVVWNIEGKKIRGIAEQPVGRGLTLIKGDYEVTVLGRSENGVYNLTWGDSGTEQLIPATPRSTRSGHVVASRGADRLAWQRFRFRSSPFGARDCETAPNRDPHD
jgi:hypothetical protein